MHQNANDPEIALNITKITYMLSKLYFRQKLQVHHNDPQMPKIFAQYHFPVGHNVKV